MGSELPTLWASKQQAEVEAIYVYEYIPVCTHLCKGTRVSMCAQGMWPGQGSVCASVCKCVC